MKENDSNNLAIIGASGSGKTTLAIGLYATSTKTFTVSPVGDTTRKYLERLLSEIEDGHWPDPTNEATKTPLHLRLLISRHKTDIVFCEYMGERMDQNLTTYIQEIIGRPKSAMILFNPGMPGGRSKKASEDIRIIARSLEKDARTESEDIVRENAIDQLRVIEDSLKRLSFLDDVQGASSRDDAVHRCEQMANRLHDLPNSTSHPEVMAECARELKDVADKVDRLRPIGLAESETKNRLIGNLKVIAQHLKDNECIAVALVVTAEDRLSSDLAGFKDDFLACVQQVKNHLRNLGIACEVFRVTISGKLENQDKPKLARGEDNKTHEPFLWLLGRTKRYEFWKRVKTTAATVAGVLAVAGAAFCGLVWRGRSALAGAESSFGKCLDALNAAYVVSDEAAVRENWAFLGTNGFNGIRAILPPEQARKADLIARADEQRDLWGVRLLAMDFATTTNRLAANPSEVKVEWFADFGKRLVSCSPAFAEAVAVRDDLQHEWDELRLPLETRCQTGHFRDDAGKESKNLAAAKPDALVAPLKASLDLLTDKDGRYALVTNRADLCAELLAARTNAVARYVESKTSWKPTDEKPPADVKDIVQQIRRDLKSVLTSEEFGNLEKAIDSRRVEARAAWEKHQFPQRKKTQLDELKATSDFPATALKDSLIFLNDMDGLFPSIPEADRLSARTAITNERAAAIARYIDAKAGWKPEDDDPPGKIDELHRRSRAELKGTLTEAEFSSLAATLEKRCENARKSWDALHFPRRSSELETDLRNAGANPVRPLKESLAFLGSMTNDYPTIEQSDYIRARTSIGQARKAALATYADCLAAKWDVKGRKPPEFDDRKLLATVRTDAVVTDKEAESFNEDMQKRFAKVKDDWEAKQKEDCDSFVRRNLSSMADVKGSLDEYMDFRLKNSDNPSIGSVDRKMVELLENRLDWLVEEYYREFRAENAVWDIESNRSARMQKAQSEFNELRGLCLAIKNQLLEGTPIQNSWVSKFAALCIEKGGLKTSGINGAFQQRFEMSKILVKIDFESTDTMFKGLSLGANIYSRYWQDGEKYSMSETLVDLSLYQEQWKFDRTKSGKWYTLWEKPRSFIINPWTDSYFTIDWEDRVSVGFNVKDSFPHNIWSEFRNSKEYDDGYLEYKDGFWGEHDGPDTKGTITVRIFGKFTGVDLSMLLEQAKQ